MIQAAVLCLFLTIPARTPDLDIVARVESGNNPRAVSNHGALGLCQVMPDTWRSFARRGERWSNPRDNRAVAQRYLEWIQDTLQDWGDPQWNNPAHILACYNGGITYFRRCGFRINRMPWETRNYVQKYYRYARNR